MGHTIDNFWVPQLADVVRPSSALTLSGWSVEHTTNPSFVDADLHLRESFDGLGGCRIHAFGFDFHFSHVLSCWKNAHLAQPNSAFSALHQAPEGKTRKLHIENRPERVNPVSLLERYN